MSSRKEVKEQKGKTKQMLIEATLQLIAEEGFANLSLRSVARAGGIAPTSFYRYFRDMDELGLELIDASEASMREFIIQARDREISSKNSERNKRETWLDTMKRLVRTEVESFMIFLGNNADLLRLFFQERTGSNEVLRKAIAKKVKQFIDFLANEIEAICEKRDYQLKDVHLLAETLVIIALHDGLAALDLSEEDRKYEVEQMIKKVMMIFLGATVMSKEPNLTV